MAKKRLVIGNWKMYVESPDAALAFARAFKRKAQSLSGVDVAIAPSFTLIPVLVSQFKNSAIRTGAQTLSRFEGGAHTGEVSAKTLKESGASFVIVGHSERRETGENDDFVREELRRADAAGLRIILCIGEKERDAHGGHFEIISAQLSAALQGFPKSSASRLVVAYEPVWTIGKTAADAMKPHEVRETVIFVRKTLAEFIDRAYALRVPILYGGSVEPDNARALVTDGEVSGFLVGHASTDANSFLEICKASR